MKGRQPEKAGRSPGARFTSDAFYERLIVMREQDPASLLRFGRDTMAALRAYEEAKGKAAQTKKGGKR